ncbi:hypothetical protein O181_033835 [Austropuccinia psidii MF-1]|uniref:Palmitoyltransferase PFA4 n=1 Tax=Austropuccinia psidii MF-1 TaxID=1389203 RepID=A0A9Q3D3R8_9BASI|nr:hypothetical protein [Austropuccinia psidii MF-1]
MNKEPNDLPTKTHAQSDPRSVVILHHPVLKTKHSSLLMSFSINLGKGWIIATTGLISFIAFTSQIFIIIPLFDNLPKFHCLCLLVPFNLLVASVLVNYTLCVRTDPGRVPKQWDPLGELDRQVQDPKKKLLIGKIRFCNACKVFKPPRAHHCRTCKRCVLKMDHHCPWVNNCVGYHNYGHFIRFLWSVNIACWYHIWMINKRVFGEFAYGPLPQKTELVFLISNYVACIPVILAVGIFSLYHLWSLLSNTTTIEGWEKEKASQLRRKGRIHQFTYPFSLGTLRNIQAVLGKNPLLWCFPQKMTGNGLKYPVAASLDPLEQYLWPPRDLFTRRLAEPRAKMWENSPFTFGDQQLNPSLVPTRSSTSISPKVPQRRTLSPYHPDYIDNEESDSGRIANGHILEFSDSDDEPLSHLIARRNRYFQTQPIRRPIIRRGSEGFEIKQPAWSSQIFETSGPHANTFQGDGGSEGSDGWD